MQCIQVLHNISLQQFDQGTKGLSAPLQVAIYLSPGISNDDTVVESLDKV